MWAYLQNVHWSYADLGRIFGFSRQRAQYIVKDTLDQCVRFKLNKDRRRELEGMKLWNESFTDEEFYRIYEKHMAKKNANLT